MSNESKHKLLELAAKAAGLVVLGYVEDYDDFYWDGPSWGLAVEGVNGVWNPIEEDGDALRLLVRLGLSVDVVLDNGEARTISADASVNICGHVLHNNNPQQATRLAIVCAAALLADSDAVVDMYKS